MATLKRQQADTTHWSRLDGRPERAVEIDGEPDLENVRAQHRTWVPAFGLLRSCAVAGRQTGNPISSLEIFTVGDTYGREKGELPWSARAGRATADPAVTEAFVRQRLYCAAIVLRARGVCCVIGNHLGYVEDWALVGSHGPRPGAASASVHRQQPPL